MYTGRQAPADWDTVDVAEYVAHNYTRRIFDEDRLLIERTAAALTALGSWAGSGGPWRRSGRAACSSPRTSSARPA